MFQGRNLEGQHAMVSRVEGQLWDWMKKQQFARWSRQLLLSMALLWISRQLVDNSDARLDETRWTITITTTTLDITTITMVRNKR